MELQDLNIFEKGLDERSKAYLLETTRWTKFLAILGFIFVGFILLFAILTLGGESYESGMFYKMGKLGAFLYCFIMGIIYFFPALYLIKFSNLMKAGIQSNNTEVITEAFRHQRNLFKYLGILSIIVIAFVLLAIIFAGVFAASFAPR